MPTLERLDYENMMYLFKGEPGTRKSTSALSFPLPQYWVNWDQKIESIGIPMLNWKIDRSKVHYDDYNNWNSVKTKLEKLQMNCPFKTVIIDSLTSGADAINSETLATKVGGGQGKTVAGIPVNSIEDFNAEDSALKKMLALLTNIRKAHKVNIIIIAHIIQKEMKSSDGSTHMSRILLTAGKGIAQKIPAYCAEVYHFNIKSGAVVGSGGKYALFTRHMGDDFARTSLPLEEEIIFGDDPLYDKWIKPAIVKMTGSTSVPSTVPSTITKP